MPEGPDQHSTINLSNYSPTYTTAFDEYAGYITLGHMNVGCELVVDGSKTKRRLSEPATVYFDDFERVTVTLVRGTSSSPNFSAVLYVHHSGDGSGPGDG